MAASRARTVSIALALISVSAGIGIAAQRAARVYLDGKLVSANAISRNGSLYVPVSDVAAAMGLHIVKRADGVDLTHAGGANQVQGTAGKVGDELFNGKFRFKVVRVVRGHTYTKQFADHSTIEAPGDKDIVAVVCRLKNGKKQAAFLDLFGFRNTALTDEDSHSFEQSTGTFMDLPTRGANLLPGAAVDFALVFPVPKDAVLKDLVYEVADFPAGQIFRVSLKNAGQ